MPTTNTASMLVDVISSVVTVEIGVQGPPGATGAAGTPASTQDGSAGLVISNTIDATKKWQWDLSGMTTGKKLIVAPLSTTDQTIQIPNITATDTFAVLGLAQTFSQIITVDLGTGAIPSGSYSSGSHLNLYGADGGSGRISMTAVANTNGALLTCYSYGGSRAVPTVTPSSSSFFGFAARGYGGTPGTYPTGASMTIETNGAWSLTNQGTAWVIKGTSGGSTTITEWTRWLDGAMLVGASTLVGAERLRITGGSTPGTPGATDVLIGNGGIKAGGILSAAGAVTFTAGTASTSTTTGTLVITGGIGASGSLYAGGASRIGSSGATGVLDIFTSSNVINYLRFYTASTLRGSILSDNTSTRLVMNVGATTVWEANDAGTLFQIPVSTVIGGTALSGSERLRITGGSTPGTAASTEVLIGNGGINLGGAIVAAGSVTCGAITCTSVASSGTVASGGGVTSSSPTDGIGYSAGAGSTVTQTTNKSTTVVLNTVAGTITLNNAALAAATSVTFTWTNSSMAATDMVLMQHDSVGTLGAYSTLVTPGAGTSTVTIRNNTAGSLSEAIVLRFIIIKSVIA